MSDYFPKWLYQFTFPLEVIGSLIVLHSHQYSPLNISHFGKYVLIVLYITFHNNFPEIEFTWHIIYPFLE